MFETSNSPELTAAGKRNAIDCTIVRRAALRPRHRPEGRAAYFNSVPSRRWGWGPLLRNPVSSYSIQRIEKAAVTLRCQSGTSSCYAGVVGTVPFADWRSRIVISNTDSRRD